MKKLLLPFILISTVSFSQQNPCDARYGKATAMPSEGWCLYAENLKKVGKPSASAECRCENGRAIEKSRLTKIQADDKVRKDANDLYNKLNDEYQIALTKSRNLPEERINEQISILNSIMSVAQQLDKIRNSTFHVSSVKTDLEYLESQKRKKTITIGSNNNSSRSKSQQETNYTQKTTSPKLQKNYTDVIQQTQQNINRFDKARANAQNTLNNFFNARQQQADKNRELEQARYEREMEERKEEERLEQLRLQKLRDERAQKERIENARSNFMNGIQDMDMPVVVNKKEVFFIIITKMNNEDKIEISPFSLIANTDNILPYKIDIVSDYKKITGRNSIFVQGPYYTFDEQKKAISSFQKNAKNNYTSYSLIKYSYEDQFNKAASLNQDFGGKEATNTPSTTTSESTDFWGEKTTKKTNTTKKTETTKSSIWE
ncbi:hypothetical protein [Flavobacterium ovatum]|uniref:hypothetical protein n=1 Tax=Flavobacterium ovatum TaxID=1928857 RepID=UPI00344E0E8D